LEAPDKVVAGMDRMVVVGKAAAAAVAVVKAAATVVAAPEAAAVVVAKAVAAVMVKVATGTRNKETVTQDQSAEGIATLGNEAEAQEQVVEEELVVVWMQRWHGIRKSPHRRRDRSSRPSRSFLNAQLCRTLSWQSRSS
jgi:hypothetical protein